MARTGLLNLNLVVEKTAQTPNSPIPLSVGSPVNQLRKADFEKRKLEVDMRTLQMDLNLRNSEVKCLQRRFNEEQERFKKELAGLKQNNDAVVKMVKEQAEEEVKYARQQVETKILEIEDIQKRFDQLKTSYDEEIKKEKLLLEEYLKSKMDFEIEGNLETEGHATSEQINQGFETLVKETELQKNDKLIEENQCLRDTITKLEEKNRHLLEGKTKLQDTNHRLQLENTTIKLELNLLKINYDEKLKEAVKRQSVGRPKSQARFIPSISVPQPFSSTQCNGKTPFAPSPSSSDVVGKRKMYKHPRREFGNFESRIFNLCDGSLDRFQSQSSPSLNEIGMSSECFQKVVQSPGVSPIQDNYFLSKSFSISHLVGSSSGGSMTPMVGSNELFNSNELNAISRIEASISNNNDKSGANELSNSEDQENENIYEEENDKENNSVDWDESLLEPLSTTLSLATLSVLTTWRQPIPPPECSLYVFVRVYSMRPLVLPRHFLAELIGEKVDVIQGKVFKVNFFMKARGKDNFLFSKNEAEKGYEIDEQNIVAYLPEPTTVDRRGRYSFNFDFTGYRLGETASYLNYENLKT